MRFLPQTVRPLLAVFGALLVLGFVLIGPPVNVTVQKPRTSSAGAHYVHPFYVRYWLMESNYDGWCGRGIARCNDVGTPTIVGAKYGHWRTFTGYYQEWRPKGSFPFVKLWECNVRGWVFHTTATAHVSRSCWKA